MSGSPKVIRYGGRRSGARWEQLRQLAAKARELHAAGRVQECRRVCEYHDRIAVEFFRGLDGKA